MEQEDVSAWQPVASKASGKVYWYNVRTGATQWHPPPDGACGSTKQAASASASTNAEASTNYPPPRHRHSGQKQGRKVLLSCPCQGKKCSVARRCSTLCVAGRCSNTFQGEQCGVAVLCFHSLRRCWGRVSLPVCLRVRKELLSLTLICMLLPCAEHAEEVKGEGDQCVARKRGRAADGDGDGGGKAEDFDCHPLHSKSKEQMVSPSLPSRSLSPSLPLSLSLSLYRQGMQSLFGLFCTGK